MFCKVKVNGVYSIYGNDGITQELNGQEREAFIFKNGQAVVLDPQGYAFVPSIDLEVLEEKKEALPNSGLRTLIGQDMKTFTVEFK